MDSQLEIAIKALHLIRDFDHDPDCTNHFVPVYECCCYKEDQTEIAHEALRVLGEEND